MATTRNQALLCCNPLKISAGDGEERARAPTGSPNRIHSRCWRAIRYSFLCSRFPEGSISVTVTKTRIVLFRGPKSETAYHNR